MILTDLDDMWRFAKCVYDSKLSPKGYANPQGLVVAMQMGAELGKGPMWSIQNIAVINGRPSLWGDGMLGICQGSEVFDHTCFEERFEGTGDALTAHCTVRRVKGKPHHRSFGVQDAKRAGLWGKSGPWTQYPQRMLQMRARAFALRDVFSDVLQGLRAAEEVLDIPMEDAEVVAVDLETAPVPPQPTSPLEIVAEAMVPPEAEPEIQAEPEPPPKPKRKRRKKADTPPPETAPQPAAETPEPAPAEEDDDVPFERPAPASPAPSSAPETLSPDQDPERPPVPESLREYEFSLGECGNEDEITMLWHSQIDARKEQLGEKLWVAATRLRDYYRRRLKTSQKSQNALF